MKSVFKRIGIGTANWGQAYGLSGVRVSKSEQEKILGYCQCNGIDMLDTATAYGTQDVGNSSFNRIVKVQKGDDLKKIAGTQPYCIMAHNPDDYEWVLTHVPIFDDSVTGSSLYKPSEIIPTNYGILQVPYSIFDRRFESYFSEIKQYGTEIHVRSIFLQGAVFQKELPIALKKLESKIRLIQGFDNPALACLLFVLLNPYVDRVIIGVDSVEQLKDNLRFFHRLDSMQETEEALLDPRKWH